MDVIGTVLKSKILQINITMFKCIMRVLLMNDILQFISTKNLKVLVAKNFKNQQPAHRFFFKFQDSTSIEVSLFVYLTKVAFEV